ncbi:SPOR domain-containing protein [Brevundimonas sp.]|uniref:SPOR domain-containing protein n=1 Tax=Brevundimonas sp. TaxID=1871086 RepID=UPI00286A78BC|nr:SPOR domain-containing protein [Brevundimonas sp.]
MSIQGLGAGLAVALVLAGASAAQDFDGSLSPAERRAVVASGLPRSQVVSIKRDLVVAIRSRGTTKGGVLFEGVQLHGEAVSAEAARNLGYRSMRSTVNVDCGRRRDMVVRMTIYPEPNGKGEPILRQVPGGWIQPSPSAFLSDVIASICSDAPTVAVAPPEPRERPAPSPPKPSVTPALIGQATPPPPPAREPEPASPAADSEAISTALTARRPRLALPPEEAVPPPAIAPSRPVAVSKAAQAPTPTPVPMVPVSRTAPRAGGASVQIAAFSGARQAQEALGKLGALPDPLSTTVQSVQVDGKTIFRALVTGFETRANAKIFCEIVVESGGACFVR